MCEMSHPNEEGWGKGRPINYKCPRKVGVVIKALEGREERQGLDLGRWVREAFWIPMCWFQQHKSLALDTAPNASHSRCCNQHEGVHVSGGI